MKIVMCGIAAAALAVVAPAAQAAIVIYDATLSGPNEAPPNASPGTGFGRITYDDVAHSLRVQINFAGLSGVTTASHIHAPTAVAGTGTAGVATQTPTFTGFPLGVTSGGYDHLFDLTLMSTYNAPFFLGNGNTAAGAESALAQALADGKAYLNVHTRSFPGGEIRGFFARSAAPEAPTWAMLIVGFGAAGAAMRRSGRRVGRRPTIA